MQFNKRKYWLAFALLLLIPFAIWGANSSIKVTDVVGGLPIKTKSKLVGGVTMHLQSSYSDTDNQDFGGSITGGVTVGTGGQMFDQSALTGPTAVSPAFGIDGVARLAFKIEYSDATTEGTFRVCTNDNNTTLTGWSCSSPHTSINIGQITNVPTMEGSFFHGTKFTYETDGAKTMRLQIIAKTGTGTISAWVSNL